MGVLGSGENGVKKFREPGVKKTKTFRQQRASEHAKLILGAVIKLNSEERRGSPMQSLSIYHLIK